VYIYKFTITYTDGTVKNEWLCHKQNESIADLKDRADNHLDEIEHGEPNVQSVSMIRRTVPGI